MQPATIEQKYLRKDNLLIIHLTDRCNNRCRFCMVDDIHSPFCFPTEEARALVEQMPAGAKIDFFGGEPTLHPGFLDLLELAVEKGRECSVASNGRAFAQKDFTRAVATRSGGRLYVRTSLYGATAASHDAMTGVTGSFQQLLAGLERIVAEQLPCQVNIVLNRHNLAELPAMVQLVIAKAVGRIKFGLIVGADSCPEIVPTLSEVRQPLHDAVRTALAHRQRVLIEKAPLCLAPAHMDLFSSERELSPWPRFFADQGECGRCLVRRWCDGLDPGYVRCFGSDGLKALQGVPAHIVKPFPANGDKEAVAFLCNNFFALPSPQGPLEQEIEKMQALVEEAGRKHARIVFVPDHLLTTDGKEPGGTTYPT